MSAGPRVPWATASEIIRWLGDVWPSLRAGSHVVGSYRRLKPDVGDIEVILPAASREHDPVYDAIAPTMRGYVPAGLHELGLGRGATVGEPVKGLRPGFREASLLIDVPASIWGGEGGRIPVQVYRYTPENMGWIMLMRTGPSEFGQWFLWKWKRYWGIPPGGKASVDGHLVDGSGKVIPVRSETYCFISIGMSSVIPPQDRDRFVASRAPGMGASS